MNLKTYIRKEIESLYRSYKKGDIVKIKEYKPKNGKGLFYPAFTGKMLENGFAGGWDVWDVLDLKTNKEVSIYGFSIEGKVKKLHEANILVSEDGTEYKLSELLKGNNYRWDVFDELDELDMKSAIKMIKDEGTYNDDLSIFVSDQAYEIASTIFKEHKIDQDKYSDEFDEVRYKVEENANYNWDKILPKVFFCDAKEEEFSGPVYSDTKETQTEEIKKLGKIGKKAGFTNEEIKKVYTNATYGGMGGVGIIGRVSGVLKGEIEGEPILYIRDSMNGSGYYVIGRGEKKLKLSKNKLLDLIDYGSHSLGDVFGTNDWIYK